MEVTVSNMVHYFLIDYPIWNKEGVTCRSGDYYRVGVEGDLEIAEQKLMEYSLDVRYISSKKPSKKDTGKRSLSNGLIIRSCKYAYTMRPVWTKPDVQSKNTTPVDRRHTVLEEVGIDG